ncbi:uncharacterized protein LOC124461484 [Drosophila willistoni]|uniref:uncharacterized protein LOC124461484 n=1 Tax=Drosophila willistoni TaxID=7260 RepID=UPI001F073D4F|nr:uncharacterized protein LOC124461484 [Drosophila willistoni]
MDTYGKIKATLEANKFAFFTHQPRWERGARFAILNAKLKILKIKVLGSQEVRVERQREIPQCKNCSSLAIQPGTAAFPRSAPSVLASTNPTNAPLLMANLQSVASAEMAIEPPIGAVPFIRLNWQNLSLTSAQSGKKGK